MAKEKSARALLASRLEKKLESISDEIENIVIDIQTESGKKMFDDLAKASDKIRKIYETIDYLRATSSPALSLKKGVKTKAENTGMDDEDEGKPITLEELAGLNNATTKVP